MTLESDSHTCPGVLSLLPSVVRKTSSGIPNVGCVTV